MTSATNYRLPTRPVLLAMSLFVSACAAAPSALAQSATYDPQAGSETGPYQAPHTGILNGRFWTDTRYRYEYVDQANLPKNARASTMRNKTGVESGFFHGFRAGVEGEFVVEIGPDDFNNTINGRTQYPDRRRRAIGGGRSGLSGVPQHSRRGAARRPLSGESRQSPLCRLGRLAPERPDLRRRQGDDHGASPA